MSQTQQSIRELFITPREKMPTECNYLYFKVRRGGQEYTSTEISDDLQETIELKSIDSTLIDDDIIKKLLSIHGSKLCAGDINKGYLLDQFEKCKYIIILLSLTETKYDFRDPANLIKRLCGLVFLDTKPNNSMYVSLICGKPGLGSKLLNFSETISKQLGYTKMKLNSLDSPIGFYLKKGYLFDESKGSVAGNVGYNISGGPDEYDPEPETPPSVVMEPAIGYIHKENNDKWILTNDLEKPWLYMKPGYINLYQRIEVEDEDTGEFMITYISKYSPKILDYLRKFYKETNMITVTDSYGKTFRMMKNGGVITNLKNIVTYKMKQGIDGVPMTKILETRITSLGGGKKKKTRKRNNRNRDSKSKNMNNK